METNSDMSQEARIDMYERELARLRSQIQDSRDTFSINQMELEDKPENKKKVKFSKKNTPDNCQAKKARQEPPDMVLVQEEKNYLEMVNAESDSESTVDE